MTADRAADCHFSNDGSNWASWKPYSSVVSWQLTGGDGVKNVYAECRSSAGTLSDVAQDMIILDTSPTPYIEVSINNGGRWTN